MQNARLILIMAGVLTFTGAAPLLAQDEVVGKVVSMDSYRIVVESKSGERLHFDLSENTRVFNSGGPIHVKRILPNSTVVVAPSNGRAVAIIIKEVPK